jgi:hypothetical protein
MARWHKARGVFVDCKILGTSNGKATIEVAGDVFEVPAHQVYDEIAVVHMAEPSDAQPPEATSEEAETVA